MPSPYLDRPLRSLDEIAELLRGPTPGDRRKLAMAALKTAIAAIEEGDYGAAAIFLDDALLHIRAARGE